MMVFIDYCKECLLKLQTYGILNDFQEIVKKYLENGHCLLYVESPCIEITEILERLGCIVTTEYDKQHISIKPYGYTKKFTYGYYICFNRKGCHFHN